MKTIYIILYIIYFNNMTQNNITENELNGKTPKRNFPFSIIRDYDQKTDREREREEKMLLLLWLVRFDGVDTQKVI